MGIREKVLINSFKSKVGYCFDNYDLKEIIAIIKELFLTEEKKDMYYKSLRDIKEYIEKNIYYSSSSLTRSLDGNNIDDILDIANKALGDDKNVKN